MKFDDILKNKRVCPMPMPWHEMYELLPVTSGSRNGAWQAVLPLALSGWAMSFEKEKKDRFLNHLMWAEEHGVLEQIQKFLENLKEEDWLHEGEGGYWNPAYE